jgi:hypothetical protein
MLLFKYLPAARVDVLQNRLIRLTQPLAFNDPFECRPNIAPPTEREWRETSIVEAHHVGMPNEVAEEFLEDTCDPEHLEAMYQVAWSVTCAALASMDGVLSLSEVPDNLLMWAHYTDCHTGLLIGFDTGMPGFSTLARAKDALIKVAYVTTRPRYRTRDLARDGLLSTKSRDWAYERE